MRKEGRPTELRESERRDGHREVHLLKSIYLQVHGDVVHLHNARADRVYLSTCLFIPLFRDHASAAAPSCCIISPCLIYLHILYAFCASIYL
jgi:hypothetical protein